MATRKGWEALKPGYRATLEKGGITKKSYEAGVSLQAARRHATTPERPSGYDAKKYPQYAAERAKLTRQLEQKKLDIFGGNKRWDAQRSSRNLREKPPSLAKIRWALAASEEEIYNAVRSGEAEYRFLGYH